MASAVGIDVEEISDRDPNFYSLAFVKEETEQIQSRPPSEQALIATQIWCAKEALGKALGNGMQNDPKKISIQLDPTADQIPSSGLKIAHGTVRTPSLVGARTHDSTPEQIKIFYGQYADLAIAFTAL
jgi:phosphopantetheinyl transferase